MIPMALSRSAAARSKTSSGVLAMRLISVEASAWISTSSRVSASPGVSSLSCFHSSIMPGRPR